MQPGREQIGQGELEHREAEQDELKRALAVLDGGGVVGYPSETVWGLAALPGYLPDQLAAPPAGLPPGIARLYRLKGRDSAKPLQLSCVSAAQARRWLAADSPHLGAQFAAVSRFWPGPLTVLARVRPGCPEWLAPGGVVGLRVPAHPAALALLAAAGGTLATTSLNPSGAAAAQNRAQAAAYGLADLLLPAGPGEDQGGAGLSGQASTVFDLQRGQVLRQGQITAAQLREALAL